ncbi:hypothetical protein CPB86DRAFT_789835 [Serendipita vermifera]|nr:hypothetical protein CPB86DRAFT_789835 [Serendipita vermifera]
MRVYRRLNHLFVHHHRAIVNGLRVFWILCLFWFEVGIFQWSVGTCRWPDDKWTKESKYKLKGVAEPAHLMVLGDTQVLDSVHSLPSTPLFLRPLVRSIVNYNMQKSWSAVKARLTPQAIVFLGDMIHGGRYATDDNQYQDFVEQFYSIFGVSDGTSVYYVVGNHDVGLGHSASFSRRARARFTSSFHTHNNQTNQVVQFGNHSLVLVDAPWLVEEDYRRVAEHKTFPSPYAGVDEEKEEEKGNRRKGGVWKPSPGGTVDFISHLSKERAAQSDPLPLLVFSHIPFARPDTASCGRFREGGASNSHSSKHGTPQISKGAGSGYQNLLGKDTSNWVLESLAPSRIFSADDHDYCEHVHSYNLHSTFPLSPEKEAQGKKGEMITLTRTRETTIKSFSTDVKIRRPGFQLVSLWNPIQSASDKEEVDSATPTIRTTVADALCLLPDQTRIYTHGYFPLITLTIFLIIWMNLWSASGGTRGKDDSPLLFFSAPTPALDRDSDSSSMGLLVDQREKTRITGRSGSSGLTVRSTMSKPSPMQLHPTHESEGSVPMSRGASPRSHSSQLEKEEDEEDGQYAHVRAADEEHGFIPRTPSSAWTAASSPVTERGGSSMGGKTGSWEVGSWKRNGGSGFGRPRSPMFGLGIHPPGGASSPHLRPSSPWGSTFGLAQNEREREKMFESGQRAYSKFSIVGTGRRLWRYIQQLDWARNARVTKRWVMGGRPSSGAPFWKRIVWNGSMVAVPCWFAFLVIVWKWIQ